MYLLASFADGPFIGRGDIFAHQVRELDVFDSVEVSNKKSLPVSFLNKHESFLIGRGFGYYIWKPVIIGAALSRLSLGDVLVYLDAGFTLNPLGRSRMLEYISICLDSAEKMLSFTNIYPEYMYTKADLASRLNVEKRSDIMATSQLSSGFIILAKTESNEDLIKMWADIAIEEQYHFSDDSPSKLSNHPLFREHRHDQSISSLLRKLRGTAVTYYEVQSYESELAEMRRRVPAWATRLRN
jgi:hypothetical protein